MAVHAISRDGMVGVRLTDASNQQVKSKFDQMFATYEVAPSMFVSGAVDTDVSLSIAEGEYLEVSQDAALDISTHFEGDIHLFPPASNGGLWEVFDVLVPESSTLLAAPPLSFHRADGVPEG